MALNPNCLIRMVACSGIVLGVSFAAAEMSYRPLPIDGGGYVQCLAVSPHDPNLVLAGIDVGGIARSTDGGRSWRMVNAGLKDEFDHSIADIAFAPSRPEWVYLAAGKSSDDSYEGRLFFSDDGGRHWQRRNNDMSFAGNWVNRQFGKILVVDPKDPLHLWAGTVLQGVLESRDGGKTWVARGPKTVGKISTLVSDPARPERMYLCARLREKNGSDRIAAGEPGVWVSNDAGQSWTKTFPQAVSDLAVSPDGSVLAGGEGFMVRSQDGGKTWQAFEEGLPQNNASVRYDWMALAADPFHPGRFLAGAKRDPDFHHPGLFVRNPQAKAWQAIDTDPAKIYQTYGRPGQDGWQGFAEWFAASTSMIVYDPTIPNRVFLTDWYTVSRSDDGGKTWRACNKGLCSTVARDAVWDRVKPYRAYLGILDVGFHTADINQGTVHSDRDTLSGAHANVYQFVWKGKVITLAGLSNWTNECLIFRRVGDGPWHKAYDGRYADRHPFHDAGFPIAFSPQTGQVLALTSNLVLLYSRDGGEHFEMYRDAKWNQPGMLFHVRFVLNRWYVAANDGLYFSENLSGDWRKSDLPGFPVGPTPESPIACLIRNGEIQRTEDGGVTWKTVFRFPSGAHPSRLAVNMGENGDIFALWSDSEGPYVAQSRDGGKTWRNWPRPPGYWPAAQIVPHPLHPSQFLYVTHGLGVWLAEWRK